MNLKEEEEKRKKERKQERKERKKSNIKERKNKREIKKERKKKKRRIKCARNFCGEFLLLVIYKLIILMTIICGSLRVIRYR